MKTRLFGLGLIAALAATSVEAFALDPTLYVLEGLAPFSQLLSTPQGRAALAIETGATVCSTDRDFRRFTGLSLIDPTELPG